MTSALGMTQKELLDLSEYITSGSDTGGHSFCGYLVGAGGGGASGLKIPKFVFVNKIIDFKFYKYMLSSVYKIFGRLFSFSFTF